jgi:hypothetical protein
VLFAAYTVAIQVAQQLIELGGGDTDGSVVGGAAVNAQALSIFFQQPTAGEHHIRNVAAALIIGVTVQSVQKVPISLLYKINSLEGYTICYLNKINDFLRF